MSVSRLVIAVSACLMVPVLAAAGTGDFTFEDETRATSEATYVGYDAYEGGVGELSSEEVEPDFLASGIVEDVPPVPRPIGRPEAGAGLPPAVPSPAFARPAYVPGAEKPPWEWHLLPGDTMFRSFIAGTHQPRMAGEVVSDDDQGLLLDTTLGSRVSLFRKGTLGPHPEGWEVQVYGAAFTRLATDRQSDVEAIDYGFGVPLVYRWGPTAYRFGYDHISSHLGDEFLIRNPGFERINYVRDGFAFAVIQDVTEDVNVYGEANYAFHNSGGSEPWHFQLGAQYQPPVVPGRRGAPVAAVNTLLRQEFGYEGNFCVVAGWQWQGARTQDLLRLALTCYTGRSRQFSYFDQYETLFGAGLYYDF